MNRFSLSASSVRSTASTLSRGKGSPRLVKKSPTKQAQTLASSREELVCKYRELLGEFKAQKEKQAENQKRREDCKYMLAYIRKQKARLEQLLEEAKEEYPDRESKANLDL